MVKVIVALKFTGLYSLGEWAAEPPQPFSDFRRLISKTFSLSSFTWNFQQLNNSSATSDEAERLTNLVLALPATNAVGERYFSALKRIQALMRNTVRQAV